MDYYCEKCGRTKDEKQFYRSYNLIKYPEGGIMNQCKDCLTLMVDNWEPETYLWILEECDVPYIPDEWNKLMATYGKDPSKLTGKSIIGRYLSKMKLKQFKDFRWKDNEFLREMAASKIEQTMKRQGYEAAEIADAINKGVMPVPEVAPPPPPPRQDPDFPQDNDYFGSFDDSADSLVSDLTDEDRTYLRIKWGKTYKPDEWVALEQLYEEMMGSYDIQTAGDINTLKLACKCSLKANQLLDIGDIDGAQKATKMYDSLMKSGKWTAAQIKEEESDVIDSIGELVAICEKEGFIPKYYTAGPQDHVDRVIEDLKQYTHDLIINESGLEIMMERAMKDIEEENERIREAAESSDEDLENKLFDYETPVLEDQDYSDFKDFELELEEENEDVFSSLLEGDEE